MHLRWNNQNQGRTSILFGILAFITASVSPSGFGIKQSLAADTPYISVGTARTKKTVIAIPVPRTTGGASSASAKTILETLKNDLAFMDIFTFLSPSAFVENTSTAGILPGTFPFKDWTSIGAEILVKSELSSNSNQNITLEGRIYDPKTEKLLLAKKYLGESSDARTVAHTFANDIVETLTGLPGIFLTKIAMSCDYTGKKEIYFMNFDGSGSKQVTHHNSISFAPAWSPDVRKIAYSLYTRHNNVKNIDLYEFDLTRNTIRLLSSRPGINSGASYSPDGKKIALTMSFGGSPEIYTLDSSTRKIEKITKSLGFDVDPSWSPDGKHMAFVTSRSGMPMVYSMNSSGGNVQRLTFAGRYNATPTWSPKNNKIGFAGWIDKGFDIFIMNPDGTHIERLTKDQGNNEDPFFSPDGNFVVFSSNRTGQKNIYVMNIDGTFVRRLTYGLGNCVAPKWSNPPVMGVSNVQN